MIMQIYWEICRNVVKILGKIMKKQSARPKQSFGCVHCERYFIFSNISCGNIEWSAISVAPCSTSALNSVCTIALTLLCLPSLSPSLRFAALRTWEWAKRTQLSIYLSFRSTLMLSLLFRKLNKKDTIQLAKTNTTTTTKTVSLFFICKQKFPKQTITTKFPVIKLNESNSNEKSNLRAVQKKVVWPRLIKHQFAAWVSVIFLNEDCADYGKSLCLFQFTC